MLYKVFLEKAKAYPDIYGILNNFVYKGMLEESEQSGSSAIDSGSLGDYKVYTRDWQRPEKKPKDKYSLPEEKEYYWVSEESINKFAEKVGEVLYNLKEKYDDKYIDNLIESMDLEFDFLYDDEDLDDSDESDDIEDYLDEDDDNVDDNEEDTLEEQANDENVIKDIFDFSGYNKFNPSVLEFNRSLNDILVSVIEEEVKPSKSELMRRKLVAGRRMRRMRRKLVSRRKVKLYRTDVNTIKKRVHRAAINFLKNKFSKMKGGSYKDLSLSAKVDVDQQVKKRANLIPNIERKLFTKYRAMMARRRKNKALNK